MRMLSCCRQSVFALSRNNVMYVVRTERKRTWTSERTLQTLLAITPWYHSLD